MKTLFLYKIRSVININRVINRYRGDGSLFNLGTGNIRGFHNTNILANEHNNNILANEHNNNILDNENSDTLTTNHTDFLDTNDISNIEHKIDDNDLKVFKSIVKGHLDYLNLDKEVINNLIIKNKNYFNKFKI